MLVVPAFSYLVIPRATFGMGYTWHRKAPYVPLE